MTMIEVNVSLMDYDAGMDEWIGRMLKERPCDYWVRMTRYAFNKRRKELGLTASRRYLRESNI